MDIDKVFLGLKTNAATIGGLRCFEYVPDSFSPPAFVISDVEGDYDQTFARGLDALTVRCQILVSRASDRSGQRLLKHYLSGHGPLSLKTALESDRTLNGACDDLRVTRFSGYRLYEYAGTEYYGAEISVFIIGRGGD